MRCLRDRMKLKNSDALCLRACTFGSISGTMSLAFNVYASGAPASGAAIGATVPVFLASFNVLSLATKTLRTEEKFYQSTGMSDTYRIKRQIHTLFLTPRSTVLWSRSSISPRWIFFTTSTSAASGT